MSTEPMHDALREEAFDATLRLYLYRLTDDPHDGISVADRAQNVMAIRIPGKPISALTPDDFAVVRLDEEALSGDVAIHQSLYRRLPGIRSAAVVRSRYVTALAKNGRSVRSFSVVDGYFDGDVPCFNQTDAAAGVSVVGVRLAEALRGSDPARTKAVLIKEGYAVLTADSPMEAVDAAITLEVLAERTYYADRVNEKLRAESTPADPLHKRLMRAAGQSKK